mgnify:CR=1 FL=1
MFAKNVSKIVGLSAVICAFCAVQARAQAPSFVADQKVSGSEVAAQTAAAPISAPVVATPAVQNVAEPIGTMPVNELKVSDPEVLKKVKSIQEEIMLMELEVKKGELNKKLDDLSGKSSDAEALDKAFSVKPLPTNSKMPTFTMPEVEQTLPRTVRIRKEYGRMVAVVRAANGNDIIAEEGKVIDGYKIANIYSDRVVVKKADKKDAKLIELEFVGNNTSSTTNSSSGTNSSYPTSFPSSGVLPY